MRELRFRKWNFEEKEMIPGDCLAFEEYAPLVDLLNQKGIMQYTGRKDKNGIEIYEGDIVQNRTSMKDVIKWSENELMWVAKSEYPDGRDSTIPLSDLMEVAKLEVIGHIYDGVTNV